MAKTSILAKRLRHCLAGDSGATAVTFALAVVPMLLAAGASIDYVRYASARTSLQGALDSAALSVAAASTLSTADRVKAGKTTFAANIATSNLAGEDISLDIKLSGKKVQATAKFAMPTAFMQLAGLSAMDAEASTEINLPDAKKAEIVLVLDYSGSMEDKIAGQKKYVSMGIAAKKLVTDLSTSNPGNVKISLVPFSHHVYVTLPNDYVVGKGTGGTWTGCTQDRQYPFNTTDATPTAGNNKSKWGQPTAPDHAAWGCSGYVSNSLKVKPLSSDFAGVKAQLDVMKPYAWTHIALGAEFGYHLLSPNAPFTEAADYSDTKTRKFMVILTDGMQTEPAFGPGSSRNVSQGEKNLEAVCANAKASGITIMTIAYDLDDTDTRKRLKGCASDPDKDFFVADDGSQVSAAFEQIKTQITARVYISK